MYNKLNFSIIAFLSMAILLFASCEKDNVDDSTTDEDDVDVEVIVCDSFTVSILTYPSDFYLEAFPTGGNPPYTYEWSNGGIERGTSSEEAGEMSIIVTDSEGCTTETAIFFDPGTGADCTDLSVTIETYPSDFWIEANVSGGTEPYSYLWNTEQTSAGISVNETGPGVYSVLVTDSEGCTFQIEEEISFEPIISCDDLTVSFELDAFNTLSVIVEGGTPSYVYSWSTGEMTSSIVLASSNSFSVTVTDFYGCTAIIADYFEIEGGDCDSFTVELEAFSDDFYIESTVSGGTPPYSYLWETNETTSGISVSETGAYALLVTDANGCTTSNDVFFSGPSTGECSNNLDLSISGDSSFELNVNAVAYLFTSDCSEFINNTDHNYLVMDSSFDFWGMEPNIIANSDGVPGISFGSIGAPSVGDVLSQYSLGTYEGLLFNESLSSTGGYILDGVEITITETGDEEGEYISGTISGTVINHWDTSLSSTINGTFCAPILEVCP